MEMLTTIKLTLFYAGRPRDLGPESAKPWKFGNLKSRRGRISDAQAPEHEVERTKM